MRREAKPLLTTPTGMSIISFDKKMEGKPVNYDKVSCQNKRLPAPPREGIDLSLLRSDVSLLLAMPLRVPYLPSVHAGKHMGNVVQRHHMAVPGLR
jgi:hypothetical protein